MAAAPSRNVVVDILLIVVGAIMLFNAAFIMFAHGAGMFRIMVGPPPALAPDTSRQAREQLLEEQRAVVAEQAAALQAALAQVEQERAQVEAEKKYLESVRQDVERLRGEVAALLAQRDQQVDAQYAQQMAALSKMYDAMKAEQVAQIFERMDDTSVIEILRRMKMRNSARVLGRMNPHRAGMLSELMRQLPQTGS